MKANEPGGKQTVLVVLEMTGGNDGLNTVIPFGDDAYAKARPTLRQPANRIKKIDDYVGLHPAMDGFAKLLEDGRLAVVQGVGYPNPSRSHFRSMDIWQAGSLADEPVQGWLGGALGRWAAAGAAGGGGGGRRGGGGCRGGGVPYRRRRAAAGARGTRPEGAEHYRPGRVSTAD